MALTWWESKIQQDLRKNGKIISVWKTFRQAKGQSIQEYTHEFRKRAIALNVALDTQENIL